MRLEMTWEKDRGQMQEVAENDANYSCHHSFEGGVDDGKKPASSQMREASS
jgi:hypothetical protein